VAEKQEKFQPLRRSDRYPQGHFTGSVGYRNHMERVRVTISENKGQLYAVSTAGCGFTLTLRFTDFFEAVGGQIVWYLANNRDAGDPPGKCF
jgi:hypothetical protein